MTRRDIDLPGGASWKIRNIPILGLRALKVLALPILLVPAWAQDNDTSEPKSSDADEVSSAGDPAQFPALNEIVVTGERGVPLAYPGGRDLIDRETLTTYPDANVESVLRRVPGLYFLPENGNDARVHIGLRGNDPRRSGLTAVLVDGIPVAEAPYGNTDIDGLPISFERIWKTDVIRGGASVRYGPNSAGGVVNFLTEPIPDAPFMRFGARYGSNNEAALWTTAGGTWDRFGVLATGVYKEGDGFRDRSDYAESDGSIKLKYALTDQETLSGTFSRFTDPKANQAGGLTQAAYDQDPKQSLRRNNYFEFNTNRYVLQYENRMDSDRNLQLQTWWQEGHRVLADLRPVVAPYTHFRAQNSNFSSGALEARYAWATDIGGMKHSFYHSARYLVEANDVLYVRNPLPSGPIDTPHELDADFKGHAFSIFNEDRVSLTETVDWAFGFRLESIVMSGVSNEDGNQIVKGYDVFLPETNIAWNIRPETALYGSYQRTFYPAQYETGFDPASVLYAPTDPESANAFEVGVRSREVEGLEVSLAIFETQFSDKIDFLNTPDGKVPINSGDARSRGLELAFDYDLSAAAPALNGLSLYGSITEQRSRVTSGPNDGNDTPDSPHTLASWGAMYEHNRTGLWARLGGSYSGSSFRDAANTAVGTANGLNGPVPSFSLWDVAIGWRQNPDSTGLSVSVGSTNIFDEEYFRRFATGIYPGAPQLFSAVVTYTIRL